MNITETTTKHDHRSNVEREDWEIAGEAWGHAAADWAYGFEPHSRDAIDAVFNHIGAGAETRLLDVACGSGYALGRAERLGAATAGIDASSELIEIAGRRAPQAQLVTGSMFDLPWGDESFDAVTSFNGIWGGCQPAIDEAFRVLRPGGSIAVTFWGPGRNMDLRDFFIVVGTTAPGAAEELKDLASIGAPGVAEAMMESAGFEVGERANTTGVIEAVDADDAWRILRSPGAVYPSLVHTGEVELRRRVMEVLAPFAAPDGTFRLENEVTHLIAHKR